MADNSVLPATGETVRSVDKGGKKAEVVILDLGGAGAESLLTTTLPVSGTVTANLSATDNAVLDAIVTALGVLATADADLTQKITVTTAGTPVQGPAKTNANGWYLTPGATNTGVVYWMFHGQTAANKGVPIAVGGQGFVPVSSLDSLDFDGAANGNIVWASKA